MKNVQPNQKDSALRSRIRKSARLGPRRDINATSNCATLNSRNVFVNTNIFAKIQRGLVKRSLKECA